MTYTFFWTFAEDQYETFDVIAEDLEEAWTKARHAVAGQFGAYTLELWN